MSDNKEMSKRQARREQIRRKEQMSRFITIGVVSIAALAIAFLFIYPNIKPAAAVLTPVEITRNKVDFNSAGDPNAPIKIDEYADFQCPYCRRFYDGTEEQFIQTFVDAGTVYFTFHSFGNFIGAESVSAAEAAYCAGDQGKFWEMHDLIFTNQPDRENSGGLSDRRLISFGDNLGLDMQKYRACFTGRNYKDKVNEDAKNALLAEVTATPTFILTYTVNGEQKTVKLEGAQTINVFQDNVNTALTEMGQ